MTGHALSAHGVLDLVGCQNGRCRVCAGEHCALRPE